MQPQRPGIRDQRTEDTAPTRQVADPRPRLVVDPVRDEPLQRRPALIDHSERRVPRGRDERSGLDDPREHSVQRQLGTDRETCLQQGPNPVGLLRVHGGIEPHTPGLTRVAPAGARSSSEQSSDLRPADAANYRFRSGHRARR